MRSVLSHLIPRTVLSLMAIACYGASWAQSTASVSIEPRVVQNNGNVAEESARRLKDSETLLSLNAEGRLLLKRDKIALPPYSYCSLAVAAAERGDFRESIDAAARALVLAGTEGNPDLEALAKRDLALTYSYAGDLDNAERYAQQALSAHPKNPSAVFAPAHKVLGDVAMRRGQPAAASARYRQALAVAEAPTHATTQISFATFVLFSLANAQIASGDLAGARTSFNAIGVVPAELIPQRDRTEANLLLAEKKPDAAKLIFNRSLNQSVNPDAAYDVLWAHEGLARTALAQGDRTEALADYKLAIQDAERIRARFRSDEFKTGLFGDVQIVYEQAILLSAESGDFTQAWRISEQSRARTLLDVVRDRGNSGGAQVDNQKLTGTAGDLAGLQRDVRFDETIVEYHSLPDRLIVWTIGHDTLQGHILPIPRDQLALAVDDFRHAIIRRDPVVPRYADRLGALLIAPLKLANGQRLIVVPNGALHYLPFQALREQGQYLVERHPIALAPSASVGVALLNRENKRPPSVNASATASATSSVLSSHAASATASAPSSHNFVAFGDPTITPAYALPGAASEVKTISSLFRKNDLYLGVAATRANFDTFADDANILHIATHAQADAIDPMHSKILLAPATQPADGPDALLASDIYGMNLHGVSMVALSACETGLGRITRGDEIMGFNRAFLYAGASTLLVSMWPVSDASTSLGMKTLYTHLVSGDEAIDAIRASQLAVMHTPGFEAPFFWAPFNLLGDWRMSLATATATAGA